MAHDLEAELDKLSAVADLGPEAALPALRKALTHRSNLMVARAAKLAHRLSLKELSPELVTAFERFMPPHDAVKLDPQCWGKNELAKALATFEAQLPDLFLRGMRHKQMEPSWGGETDSAGPLRGTCALALVQCRDIPSMDLLRFLIPLFSDADRTVQQNGIRAVEQVGIDSSSLLLRLRAELGGEFAEVIGACISGVLRLDGDRAVPWAAGLIQAHDETSNEAAFALSETRSPAAFEHLREAVARNPYDRELQSTLFAAIASMRIPPATEWLLEKVRLQAPEARAAAKALWDSQPSEETSAQLVSLGSQRPAGRR